MTLSKYPLFLASLSILLALCLDVNCNQRVSTIHCEKVIKTPRRFDSIPELEFLGMQSFCQIMLLNCNIIFQKSKFDKISVSAFRDCNGVDIDFSVSNSFTSDVFKVIIPSIDYQGKYTISFISENNFLKRKNKLLGALLTQNEQKQQKMIEKTYRKLQNKLAI
jgi:hypothetical protein